MTASVVLSCSDVRYRYGSFEAVSGVDLEVRPGEVFALLGTNGAGKTTLLEVLRGHRAPAAGAVRLWDADPARHRRRLAPRIGVVPQQSGFAPGLTVAETLRLWARLGGRAAAAGGLAEVRLDHRARVPVRQLSGGERRRLDLAIALAGDPPLLLLDEPTAGLDPESRDDAWAAVRRRVRAGGAVLLTTHHLEEAERYADRIAVMHGGRIAARLAGPPPDTTLADLFRRIAGTAPADAR